MRGPRSNARTAAHAAAFAAAWLVPALACAHHAADHAAAPAYVAAAPGTYVLHRIMPAPEGRVLDLEGRVQPLSRFTRGKITLLGFIYTTCVDAHGCPLAYRVFDTLNARIQATPALAGKVRLVTLSFDPARDTPAVMARYAGSRVRTERGLEWFFLTTRSARDLGPLVDGFGQDVRYVVNRSNGRTVRELSHVLKVFLIDRLGYVREIYTSAFLHPDAVMNDIETLHLESPG